MTRASLVIPSRGGAERLPVLLGALEEQTHPDWEAVVVLDGDIDGSEAVVSRYRHLPVRCITFPENRGRVAALNAGFEVATGDVFIRADDDFEPSPGHVAAHVTAHEQQECGVIGLPLNIAPDNAYMRVYGQEADRRGRSEAYAMPASDRWRLWGGNTSSSRDTFHRLGGFDPRYQGYGWEDLDFGYRLHQLGLPIELLPEAEVRHHMAAVNTSARARRAYRSGQGRKMFESLHGAGASGPARRQDRSPWGLAVTATSNHLTYARTERLARLVEPALAVAPAALGRKMVALLVESAAVAGFASEEETSHAV